VLSLAWQEAASEAIAEKRDLWLKLADEGRPRLVTPHRVVQRSGAPVLEALAHDSGALRAFDGERIRAAGAAGPSDLARLPGRPQVPRSARATIAARAAAEGSTGPVAFRRTSREPRGVTALGWRLRMALPASPACAL